MRPILGWRIVKVTGLSDYRLEVLQRTWRGCYRWKLFDYCNSVESAESLGQGLIAHHGLTGGERRILKDSTDVEG